MGSTGWSPGGASPDAITQQTTAAAGAPPPPGSPEVYDEDDGRFFIYPFDPVQLTASQTNVQAQIALDNDADFLWDRIAAVSTGLFSVFLLNSSLAVPLMSNALIPIFGENCSGPAGLPLWLPRPYRIFRGSILSAAFNDRSGAPNTIEFCLIGYKVS